MAMSATGAERMPQHAITSYRWPEVARMSQIISWQLVSDATSHVRTRCRTNSF